MDGWGWARVRVFFHCVELLKLCVCMRVCVCVRVYAGRVGYRRGAYAAAVPIADPAAVSDYAVDAAAHSASAVHVARPNDWLLTWLNVVLVLLASV